MAGTAAAATAPPLDATPTEPAPAAAVVGVVGVMDPPPQEPPQGPDDQEQQQEQQEPSVEAAAVESIEAAAAVRVDGGAADAAAPTPTEEQQPSVEAGEAAVTGDAAPTDAPATDAEPQPSPTEAAAAAAPSIEAGGAAPTDTAAPSPTEPQPSPSNSKKRKPEFVTWFPTGTAAPTNYAVCGEGAVEGEGAGVAAVEARPPTRRAYVSKDGTALVWDAPTLLELRAGRHILSRAIGMGSIRVSANQKAVPAALLPPALALAVEENFLSMGEAAPSADTDHFDKGVLNSEQMQMMEEERLARKLRRLEMLQQRALEEAMAAQQQAAAQAAAETASMDVDEAVAVAAPAADPALAAVVKQQVKLPMDEPPPAPALAHLGRGCGDAPPVPAHLALVRPLESLQAYHTPEEARLRAVYRDLWERGLTVGCGSPYGADFTAYEGDPMAFHSFAAVVVKDARCPLSARELSASVRLEQSVVKLLVYALCHELPQDSDIKTEEEGRDERGKLPLPWAAASNGAATTRFGPPRRRVGRFLIEYITMRFISVTRRME